MRSLVIKFLSGLIVFAIVSCGGGGGSGGSSGSKSARTGIRILNGAIDSAPLELILDGTEIIQTAKFADETTYAAVSAGTHSLSMSPRLAASNVLFNSTLNIENGQHYSLLLFGNRDTIGLGTTLISDASVEDEIQDGIAKVRLVHAVVGAAEISGSAGGNAISNLRFGNGSSYVDVPAGVASILVKRSADQKVVSSFATTLESRKAYTVFATGEIDYFLVTRLLIDN